MARKAKTKLVPRIVFNSKSLKGNRFEVLPTITIYKYNQGIEIEIGWLFGLFEIVILWRRKLKE